MDNVLPYALPVITMLALLLAFGLPGGMTGMVAGPGHGANVAAKAVVYTLEGQVLPAGSIVTVRLGGRSASMNASEFIVRSGGSYELAEGSLDSIGYRGRGYTGNHSYVVGVSGFNISTIFPPGNYTLAVEVSYEGKIISSAERAFAIG